MAFRLEPPGGNFRIVGLTGHLCPFSGCRELARFAQDFGKAVGEAVEATARRSICQRTAEHLEHMLSSEQRIDHPAESSSQGGERCLRLRSEMPRFGTSQLEFPLQIGQCHVEITQIYSRRFALLCADSGYVQ
jgi:hypothetical protein